MSIYGEQVLGRRCYGRVTQTAGTVITRLVEPWKNAFAVIVGLRYRVGANDHILTVMRPLNKTTIASDAAASQKVINITADPGNYPSGVRTGDNAIAANDYCVYQAADGTYVLDTVASVSTLAITMTTNVPTGGAKAGAPFWFFGIVTDTNPNDALAHPRYNLLANREYVFSRADGISTIPGHKDLTAMSGKYEPLVLISDNDTAAGFLESVGVEYRRDLLK